MQVMHGQECSEAAGTTLSAAELNEMLFYEALGSVDMKSREHFLQSGKQLIFLPDR